MRSARTTESLEGKRRGPTPLSSVRELHQVREGLGAGVEQTCRDTQKYASPFLHDAVGQECCRAERVPREELLGVFGFFWGLHHPGYLGCLHSRLALVLESR